MRVTPPTKLPGVITTPLSWLYRIGITHRNKGFDAGRGVTKLDRPVISIGNLSTGGTGKTPMVHLVARILIEHGHHPVIAMRGYGAKPGEKGDEQREHELALPGIPIVAQPDRLAGLRQLFVGERGSDIDCVILDDGFQHRRIERDLDIVLIDVSRPPRLDALLPKGHLREPVESLSRAGLVVLTHCELRDHATIEELVSELTVHLDKGVVILKSSHSWASCLVYTRTDEGWQTVRTGVNDLQGRSLYLICGIGNAEAFEQMAIAHGVSITGSTKLQDHTLIPQSLIDEITQTENSQISMSFFMTRKDWVKASAEVIWPIGSVVIVPELSHEMGAFSSDLHASVCSIFDSN